MGARTRVFSILALAAFAALAATAQGQFWYGSVVDRNVNDPDHPETRETVFDDGWWHWMWAEAMRQPLDQPVFWGVSATEPYAVRAEGVYRYHIAFVKDPATGQQLDANVADAECSIDLGTGSARWIPDRYDLTAPNRLDLGLVEGAAFVPVAWIPDQPFTNPLEGDPACSKNHVYHGTVQVPDGHIAFGIHDDSYWDNREGLRARIEGQGPRWTRNYPCPKYAEAEYTEVPRAFVGEVKRAELWVDSHRHIDASDVTAHAAGRPHWVEAGHLGILTCNWLVAGHKYLLFANGTYVYDVATHSPATPRDADAECSRVPQTPESGRDSLSWYDDNAMGIQEDALFDGLDLWVGSSYRGQHQPVWHAMTYHEPNTGPVPGGHPDCDPGHSYWSVYRPDLDEQLNLDIVDAAYAEADNAGLLHVTVIRVPE